MFNDHSSPIQYLLTRRSAKPRELIAPGPDAAELDQILQAAARTPDHGKLFPWRFVVIEADRRAAFAELLTSAYRAEKPLAGKADLEKLEQFAAQAPTLVVLLSRVNGQSPIPVWEQELSSGAVAMNLLHAANALGYGGGWLTGWATYSETVIQSLGEPGDKIAGFFFLGTPSRETSERPRPDMDAIVTRWQP